MTNEDRETPVGFFHYAHSYASSAAALRKTNIQATHPDSPIRFLYSHALELYLKSSLRLNGVTIKELRSKDLGHDMKALRKKAKEFGLLFNSVQAGQIDLLGEAILDRYIKTGFRTVLLPETLHKLCLYLHNSLGKPIYQDAEIKRDPISLID
ncbi:hypothetical protein [Emcibacter sp.]|uniref:hypothetical protein n=1 Tax=Emcibacter sp. TaxID=1979954 RepID=UPI003A8DE20F